jgi:protein involved in polysaccharide export with SLBB domain
MGQDAASMLQAGQARQGQDLTSGSTGQIGVADVIPRADNSVADQPEDQAAKKAENERLEQEVREAKAKDKGPLRFASDLFDTRQYGSTVTDGGIAEDYILGTGDRLQMNVFGSATFSLPLKVDGRGAVVIPKVGTVPVAGLTLGRARSALQSKIGELFSRTTVDLAVTKLREVRVFVLGEVYKPGAFLVPSLSSVVNVLSLSGGPTSIGSFREIRVMRGGRVIQTLDLYPLRAEGKGNLNLSFQNGDTLFVPLLKNQVKMEGAFTRVVATVGDQIGQPARSQDSDEERRTKRQIREAQAKLGVPLAQMIDVGPEPVDQGQTSQGKGQNAAGQGGLAGAGANGYGQAPGATAAGQSGNGFQAQGQAGSSQQAAAQQAYAQQLYAQQQGGAAMAGGAAIGLGPQAFGQTTLGQGGMGMSSYGQMPYGTANGAGVSNTSSEPVVPRPMSASERSQLESHVDLLQRHLVDLKARGRGDKRISAEGDFSPNEFQGQPDWLTSWLLEGQAPSMQFEMLPHETVNDALHFAGGFALKAFSGAVTLRRIDPSGSMRVVDVPTGEAMAACTLQKGDVLTALPLRDVNEGAVTIGGWTRVQGVFALDPGQRVGDFLKQMGLVLPDTYLERAELVRTQADGSKRYQAFNVAKAMAGDPEHNLMLEKRDAVELYRVGDLRVPQTLTVQGAVTKPGTFEFMAGMRASDLLFRAGVPLDRADRYVAELAHVQDGQRTEIRQLDLSRLLSNAGGSPVDLRDEHINPSLAPFDQLSVFSKPDYRAHRTVTLEGQVARPGIYELESARTGLLEVIKRAGGFTPEAMPQAGIFLRSLGGANADKLRANALAGLDNADPTSNGINDILARLNETKRSAIGTLQINPLLHGLTAGSLNRLVVDWPAIMAGDPSAEVQLQDGDEIIIPRHTEVAYVVGETASPFAAFQVAQGMTVKDLLAMAGGPTRNADKGNIRLLKADGRIVDSWVKGKRVEAGDAVLVPQRIRNDVAWQSTLAALTPLAILINAFK